MRLAILGAGFIGKNLISAAVKKGCFVSVLSRHTCPQEYQASSITWVKGDFNDRSNVIETIKGADVVYHLISNSVPGDKVAVEDDLFENVSNTIRLLDCCHAFGVGKLVFLSSSSIYGEQAEMPIKESAVPSPTSTHAIQKITLEYYLLYFKELYDLDIKIVRLSNPYGPGQDIRGRQGFISIILGNVIAGKTTTINGSQDVIRDFIYIDDVISALLTITNFPTKDVVFNLGSGQGVKLLDIIHLVSNILSYEVKYEIFKERDAGISKSILDNERIRNLIGFKPNISLSDGIKKYASHLELLK